MGDTDRLKAALESIVRASIPHLDYFGRYPSKVVAQNADGTLELVPDDPRVPPQSGIPIYIGVPGVTVTVVPGARVLLAWAAADPTKPIAELWQLGSVSAMTVAASSLKLGSGVAVDAVIKGTTYRTAEDTMLTALDTYLAAIVGADPTISAAMAAGGPTGPAGVYAAARAAFSAASSLYLSTITKTA